MVVVYCKHFNSFYLAAINCCLWYVSGRSQIRTRAGRAFGRAVPVGVAVDVVVYVAAAVAVAVVVAVDVALVVVVVGVEDEGNYVCVSVSASANTSWQPVETRTAAQVANLSATMHSG